MNRIYARLILVTALLGCSTMAHASVMTFEGFAANQGASVDEAGIRLTSSDSLYVFGPNSEGYSTKAVTEGQGENNTFTVSLVSGLSFDLNSILFSTQDASRLVSFSGTPSGGGGPIVEAFNSTTDPNPSVFNFTTLLNVTSVSFNVSNDFVRFDNVTIDERLSVPEPTTLTLLGLGLLGIGYARRRK